MGYDREYSLHEVHEILCASERRVRPTARGASRPTGHAITQHGDGRDSLFDRRYRTVIALPGPSGFASDVAPPPIAPIPPRRPAERDSRFVTRRDLVRAVALALNSPTGRDELRKLAHQPTITIEVSLPRKVGLRAETTKQAIAKISGQLVAAQGPLAWFPGVALGVRVLVDRVEPASPAAEIHVHTAFPTNVG